MSIIHSDLGTDICAHYESCFFSLLYIACRVIYVHAKGKGKQVKSKEDKAMTKIFEETYNTIAEAKKAYKEATTAEGRMPLQEKPQRQPRPG